MTAIGKTDPGSCTSIFHATSYPAVVKSERFNEMINNVLSSVDAHGYDLFRIGLNRSPDISGEGSPYEWADGTPLLYHNFHELSMTVNDGTVCPSINIHDTTYWQTPACDTTSHAVGTLCQFGRCL